jgi:hypothetical protein
VDFNIVAALVGTKYARNARSACKKLFEKLKANAPALYGAANPTTPEDSAGEEGEDVKPKTKKSDLKKATTAKKVGARAAPKKAAAPKKTATKKVKKEDDFDEEDNGAKDAQEEFENDEPDFHDADEDGKLFPSPPLVPEEDTSQFLLDPPSELPWKSTMNGIEATFPAGYKFPSDATEDELYYAHSHQITVESWRLWKTQNDYYDDRAVTPS